MLALQTSQKLLELFYFDINVFTLILKIFEQFGFRKDCYKLSDKIVKSDEQADLLLQKALVGIFSKYCIKPCTSV